jgi:hypothetical protein
MSGRDPKSSVRRVGAPAAEPVMLEGGAVDTDGYIAEMVDTLDVIERDLLRVIGLIQCEIDELRGGGGSEDLSKAVSMLASMRTSVVYAVKQPLQEAGLINSACSGASAADAVSS